MTGCKWGGLRGLRPPQRIKTGVGLDGRTGNDGHIRVLHADFQLRAFTVECEHVTVPQPALFYARASSQVPLALFRSVIYQLPLCAHMTA